MNDEENNKLNVNLVGGNPRDGSAAAQGSEVPVLSEVPVSSTTPEPVGAPPASASAVPAPVSVPQPSSQPANPADVTPNVAGADVSVVASSDAMASDAASSPQELPAAPDPTPPQTTEAQKKTEKIRRDREIIRAKDEKTNLTSRLGDLVVPLISLIVLVLVVMFVFIPFGTEIVDTRQLTKEVVKDIEANEAKIETLEGIEVSALEDQLIVVSVVVRDAMEVSDLSIEIEKLAQKHNLELSGEKRSNTLDVVESASQVDRSWVPLYADAISGDSRYTGSFNDISNFLKELRLQSRTILSLGTLKVSRNTDPDTGEFVDAWSIQMLISGYTAAPATEAGITDPVNTNVNENTLKDIYRRAGEKLSGGDSNDSDDDGSSGDEAGGSEETE